MSDKTIALSYEQKREDAIAASGMMLTKSKFFCLGCWLLIALTNMQAIHRSIASSGSFSAALRENGTSLFILGMVGLFFFFLIWLQPRLTARKIILRKVEYRFSDNGIHIQSDVASSDLNWKAFIKFREGPKVFLLYVQKGQAQFIPKRALTESEIVDLRNLISAHVKKA